MTAPNLHTSAPTLLPVRYATGDNFVAQTFCLLYRRVALGRLPMAGGISLQIWSTACEQRPADCKSAIQQSWSSALLCSDL
jgi:hypothetical protein